MNRKLSEVGRKIKAAEKIQATLDNFIARNRGGRRDRIWRDHMGKERNIGSSKNGNESKKTR